MYAEFQTELNSMAFRHMEPDSNNPRNRFHLNDK